MSLRATVAITVLLMLGAAPAFAEGAFAGLDDGWRVGLGYLNQDYREYNSGLNPALQAPIVDQEQGDVPRLGIELQRTYGSLYGVVEAHYAYGDDRYTGYACNATSCVPSATTTHNTILTSSFKLGPVVAGDTWRLVPYLVAGNWVWDREIASTSTASGGSEVYHFGYLGGGLLFQLAADDGVIWSLQALAARTVSPAVNANINGNDMQLDLGPDTLWRAQTRLDIPLAGPWWLSGDVGYTEFRFGASPVYASGNLLVQEPESRTRQWTYDVGVGRHF